MKVFVTGGSGLIGSSLVPLLIQQGHRVGALARSDTAASKVSELGAEILRGDLENYHLLKKAASESDAIVHLGFIRNQSKLKECSEIDRKAIMEMTSMIRGTNKPFIGSFGTMTLPSNRVATEQDRQPIDHKYSIRSETQDILLKEVNHGVAAMAVRIAPLVHGKGDKRGIHMFISLAKKHQRSPYVGDGINAWAALHPNDVASLMILALENPIPGAVLHAVHEQGVAMKDIAAAIGRVLDVPVESISPGQEAAAHYGDYLANVIIVNNQVSSDHTQKILHWTPREQGVIADIEEGIYCDLN